jgi:hypothetical protein
MSDTQATRRASRRLTDGRLAQTSDNRDGNRVQILHSSDQYHPINSRLLPALIVHEET